MSSDPRSVRATASAPRTISIARRAAYIVVIIVVALLVAEVGVRARAWFRYGTLTPRVADDLTIFDPLIGAPRPRPGYHLKSNKISIDINSLGFRGDEITKEKPRGTVRIACLGASTTFCTEVSNNHATWPYRLQEALQRHYPGVRIEVVNAGVSGYVAASSVKNLQYRVLPVNPDLVIYYEATNDLWFDTKQLARREGLIEQREGFLSESANVLSQHSLLFDLFFQNWTVFRSRSGSQTRKLASIPRDLPNRFIGELDKMNRMLEANDVKFLMSTFLVKYRRGQDRATQVANANVGFYYMPWMTMDDLLDGMDYYNDAILRYARAHGMAAVDDRDAIPADDDHYADFVHMTDQGCVRMAERFERFIVDQEIIPGIVAAQSARRQSASP